VITTEQLRAVMTEDDLDNMRDLLNRLDERIAVLKREQFGILAAIDESGLFTHVDGATAVFDTVEEAQKFLDEETLDYNYAVIVQLHK